MSRGLAGVQIQDISHIYFDILMKNGLKYNLICGRIQDLYALSLDGSNAYYFI